MIPGSFEYHRPTSVDEAVSLLAQHGDESRVLAGGHSLIPMMKTRLAQPSHLIDLQDIADLQGIRDQGDIIEIGAMTTQHDVLGSALVGERLPIIHETARLIADPQVRYCGTLGGNVANGDPGNDMPALMQCLDASYVVQGPDGTRSIPARGYYEAAYFTALDETEVLTAIRIPVPAAGHGFAYEKLKRKVGDYATSAAAVVLTMANGACTSASIALTNVSDTPLWAEAAGQALLGTRADFADIDQAAHLAADITDPVSDMRGPAEYRTHVTKIMTARAIRAAVTRAS